MTAPLFCLSVYNLGQAAGTKVLLEEVDLRQTLLLASQFDQERVGLICMMVEERGRCEMGNAEFETLFILEKILRS